MFSSQFLDSKKLAEGFLTCMCVLVQGESMVGCSIKPISGLPQRSFYFALYLIKQKNTFSISLPELVSSEHFDALK